MFSTAFNAHPDSIRNWYLSCGLTNIKSINFTVLGYIPDVDLKTENVAKTFLKSLHNKNWIRSHCGFNFPHSTQILFPHCERISFSLFREAASAISLTDLWQKKCRNSNFGQNGIRTINNLLSESDAPKSREIKRRLSDSLFFSKIFIFRMPWFYCHF